MINVIELATGSPLERASKLHRADFRRKVAAILTDYRFDANEKYTHHPEGFWWGWHFRHARRVHLSVGCSMHSSGRAAFRVSYGLHVCNTVTVLQNESRFEMLMAAMFDKNEEK